MRGPPFISFLDAQFQQVRSCALQLFVLSAVNGQGPLGSFDVPVPLALSHLIKVLMLAEAMMRIRVQGRGGGRNA